MSNVRTIHTNNYAQIHNKAGIDKTLSSKAKGILLTAMTLPPEYEINKSTFHEFFKDGRDSIKAGLEELILAGYGFHEQYVANGKFCAMTLISDVKLTTLAKLDREELEVFVCNVSDDLLYALERIRETGLTYIGKLHNEHKKKEDNETVTDKPLRQPRVDKSVSNKKGFIKKDNQNEIDNFVNGNLPLNFDSEIDDDDRKSLSDVQIDIICNYYKNEFKGKLKPQMIGSKIRIAKDKLKKGEIYKDFSSYLFSLLSNEYTIFLDQLELDQQKKEYKEKLKKEVKMFDSNIFYNWLEK